MECGVDGVVMNLDELLSHLNGFDHTHEEVMGYKYEFGSLLNVLETAVRVLHKEKIPYLVTGGMALNHEIVQFLVEKGCAGIVVPRYEIGTAQELLVQAEKKLIAKKIAG